MKLTTDFISGVVVTVLFPVLMFLGTTALRHLKRWAEEQIETAAYYLDKSFRFSFSAILSLKRYSRLQLSSNIRYLYVPSTQDVRVEVDTVFVPLTLRTPWGNSTTIPDTSILDVGNRIIIVGEPGSGKSSLLKKQMLDASRRAIRSARQAMLPVLLELKRLAIPEIPVAGMGEWLYMFIRAEVGANAVHHMKECFDQYAQTSGLLILLDGLDEVSAVQYSAVESAINELSSYLHRQGTSNAIVMTVRTHFYNSVRDAFRDTFSDPLIVKPFSPSDIYDFLNRWPFHDGQEPFVSGMYAELSDRPTLREMCSNPLVLSMYVADRQQVGSLTAPESRTEFYRRVTDELLIRRRLRQLNTLPAVSKLREERERVFSLLAFAHVTDTSEPLNSLLWSKAIQLLSEKLPDADRSWEEILDEFAKETGLIVNERMGENFRFIHLTFCEFLAALHVAQDDETGWERLIGLHKTLSISPELSEKSRLLEVIPFAAGLLPRYKRSSALSELYELGDSRLVARAFLETKLYDHPRWADFVNTESTALASIPEAEWDTEWLQRLHLFSVVLRDADVAEGIHGIRSTFSLDEFFRQLFSSHEGSVEKLLGTYASQDPVAAFRVAELCGINLAYDFPALVIEHCDSMPLLGIVHSRLGAADGMSWLPLLCEASLRYPVTAKLIEPLTPQPAAEKMAAAAPHRSRWWHSRLAKKTTLSTYLTAAAVSPHSVPEECVLLRLLHQIPAPGSKATLSRGANVFLYGMMMLMALMILVAFIAKGRDEALEDLFAVPGPVIISVLCAGGVIMLLGEWNLAQAIRWKYLYRRVMNIPDTENHPPRLSPESTTIGFVLKLLGTISRKPHRTLSTDKAIITYLGARSRYTATHP
jgi:hypothetical protein